MSWRAVEDGRVQMLNHSLVAFANGEDVLSGEAAIVGTTSESHAVP